MCSIFILLSRFISNLNNSILKDTGKSLRNRRLCNGWILGSFKDRYLRIFKITLQHYLEGRNPQTYRIEWRRVI